MNIVSAFVFAMGHRGLVASTTRPNRPSAIGLPGGKLDKGESPLIAVRRESLEEGWEIYIPNKPPIHRQLVDGNMVEWFLGYNPRRLQVYKESNRIYNRWSTIEDIISSGYGNDFLVEYLKG